MDKKIEAAREVIMGFFTAREAATRSPSLINGYEAEAIAREVVKAIANYSAAKITAGSAPMEDSSPSAVGSSA